MTRQGWRLAAAWVAALSAPMLWAATMQAGQILPYVDCARNHSWTALAASLAAALALPAALLCWRARPASWPGRFASAVGSLLGVVLVFAMLLQATAAFMLSGCQR